MKLKMILGIVLGTVLMTLGACTADTPESGDTDATEVQQPAGEVEEQEGEASEPGETAFVNFGTVNVYVTDAPPDREVTSIMVTVTEVQIHRATAEQEQEQEQEQTSDDTPEQEMEQEQEQSGEGDGEWITIDLSDSAITFDLLEVAGIEQFIGDSIVAAGKYTQVRLVVSDAQVALDGGALQEADVASGELKIVRPFDVIEGETTALVLDFDADKMVTVTGNDRIIVKPVVKLTVRQEKDQSGNGSAQSGKSDGDGDISASIEVSCDDFTDSATVTRQLTIGVGETFRVALCSNASTGFSWTENAVISDNAAVSQVRHEYDEPNSGSAVGTAGRELWTFNALRAGTTTITVEYARPWEEGVPPERTFELTVTIE